MVAVEGGRWQKRSWKGRAPGPAGVWMHGLAIELEPKLLRRGSPDCSRARRSDVFYDNARWRLLAVP